MPSHGFRSLPLLAFIFLHSSVILSAAPWPQWRGLNRNGHTAEPLPASFSPEPKILWRGRVGHGYASPVVAGGRLALLAEHGDREAAHLFDAATGRLLWRVPVGETYADEFEPGPRCTPLLDGDRLYVQTTRGEFRCLNLADGSTRWRFHFRDYGATWTEVKGGGIGAANRRGNSGSPVIVDDRIVVQVGSEKGACLVAFDKLTGRELWKSQDDLTTYSSLSQGLLAGAPQIVSATCEGLLAVSPRDGALLWRLPFKTGANRNVLTPLLADDTVYFASHTTGLRATKIRRAGDGFTVEDAWFNRQLRINLSTPVLVRGHLYGLGPTKNYLCVDQASGKVAWSQPGFGDAASTVASGDRLLVLADTGEALLLKASPAAYEELGRFQLCGKTYSHPALADGILYVRDSREMVAWRVIHQP